MRAVLDAVTEVAPNSLLDLGCGSGDLLVRLVGMPQIARLAGLDIDTAALERLRVRLRDLPGGGRVDLRLASMLEPAPDLTGFACATLVETIEHLDPAHLSRLETGVFGLLRPGRVIVTTPNAEFNHLLGVPPHRLRHPGHRFEWNRARFRDWARRVAGRTGYAVGFRDIGGAHPDLGGASQMAVFDRQSESG